MANRRKVTGETNGIRPVFGGSPDDEGPTLTAANRTGGTPLVRSPAWWGPHRSP